MNAPTTFLFACPACLSPLREITPLEMRCPVEGTAYRRTGEIWRMLPRDLEIDFHQFVQDYERVRQAEGRGSLDPAYYRELPFRDLSGKFAADWKIRAQSYRAFLSEVLVPLEKGVTGPLKILDLGAGNGWLSYRLALRGHVVGAVDLSTNPLDGLGAVEAYYEREFIPIQADYNHLPLVGNQLDLVVFNASLHYSTQYETTVCEAWRALRPGGVLAVLDSPLYHRPDSGRQMVREREERFQREFGFPSNALRSENYLTRQRLAELGRELNARWKLYWPFYGWDWELRPLKARLAGRREPAQFALISATKTEMGSTG